MMTKIFENRVSSYLNVGILATILMVTTFMSIEPVNTPKQVLLVTLGFASFLILFFNVKFKKIYATNRILALSVIIFSVLSIVNLLISDAPMTQTLYGSFGRSTGSLTYLSLACILLLFSSFTLGSSFKKLVYAISIAGILNSIYCLLDIFGPDILGWNNTYGTILGTFGNPDFISAFLGISAVIIFPFALFAGTSRPLRIGILVFEVLALFEIVKSHAKQGIVVFIFGIVVAIYLWLRVNSKLKKLSPYYLVASVAFGVIGILGTLQIGPLTKILYKTSVSLRGVYWQTGIAMGNANPLTGIGFDSYGNYYREFRSANAMILPGPNVVTNAAHNVAIDIFSAGGYPLLLSYIGIFTLGLIASFKIVMILKIFDPLATALIVGWLGYQAQSLISINQIGLAICGWALTGALIGYARMLGNESESPSYIREVQAGNKTNSFVPLALGSVIGLLLALPPFIADASWRSALNRGDGAAIIKNATQWPKETYRMTNIAIALEKSNLPDDAIIIARENVRFNPRSYDAWKLLIQLSKSTEEEQGRGLEMLHKLDPLNTELK